MKKILPILCLLAIFCLSKGIAQTLNSGITKMVSNDILMTKANPETPINDGYVVQGNTISITGSFVNQSSETITNITIKYSDGSNEYSDNRAVNILPNQNYNFTHNTPYVVPSVGNYPIDVWIEWGGNNMSNKVTSHVKSIAFTPNKKVTYEEETGTWCGWCVRGMIWMDSMKNNPAYSSHVELIAVHDGDAMTFSNYDAGAQNNTYNTYFPNNAFPGFPSIEVDRLAIYDPQDMFAVYPNYINNFGLADISVNSTIAGTTATIVAQTHFAQALTSGYNLALVVTEDSVHNSSYNQENYYSGQTNTGNYVLPTVDNYNFHTLSSPVPGNLMYFPDVARTIIFYQGVPGSIIFPVASDTTESYTFHYSIPAGDNKNHMKAIILLIETATNKVWNANDVPLTGSTLGIATVSDVLTGLSIYPNPFTNQANINFSLSKDENVTISVTNLLGLNVMNINNGLLSAGNHNIMLNGNNLTSGMYFVTLKAGDYSLTQKVLLNK